MSERRYEQGMARADINIGAGRDAWAQLVPAWRCHARGVRANGLGLVTECDLRRPRPRITAPPAGTSGSVGSSHAQGAFGTPGGFTRGSA